MSRVVQVALGPRSYPIYIGAGLLNTLGALCRRAGTGAACLIVSDRNVAARYGRAAERALRAAGYATARAVVPAGERSKSQRQLFALYAAALRAGLDRSALVVALGGGVVGDLAGFFAATYLRGVALVQAPTSLLAMVDSSVGGKTGIDLPQGKNLVGAFHQPRLVAADLATLRTLPPREYRAGLAEVVKYGVIRDARLFRLLERRAADLLRGEAGLLEAVVTRCCALKAEVVRRDEREGGLRAILNFGHTLGHAVEQLAGYTRHRHGEAVAIGMAFAVRLSVRCAGLSPAEGERVLGLLRRLGLPVRPPACAWAAVRRVLARDKKARGRTPRFVLVRRIGHAVAGVEVPEQILQEVWHVGCQ